MIGLKPMLGLKPALCLTPYVSSAINGSAAIVAVVVEGLGIVLPSASWLIGRRTQTNAAGNLSAAHSSSPGSRKKSFPKSSAFGCHAEMISTCGSILSARATPWARATATGRTKDILRTSFIRTCPTEMASQREKL